MRLTVLASGSAGNGYVLEARDSALIIECGVRPEEVFRRTEVKPSSVVGALISHEHGDHAAYAGRYAELGIPLYGSIGTMQALTKVRHGKDGRKVAMKAMLPADLGKGWRVMPFDVRHDAAEPLGFIIEHPEAGRILFLTDTRFCPYSFRKMRLDHILVEANYSDRIMDGRVASGELEQAQADRNRATHMSIRAACDLVRANETPALKTVVLIHLSSGNASRREFVEEMERAVMFARVYAAEPGLSINLNKQEF